MYQLVIEDNGVERPVFVAEDKRIVELRRQRHCRSLTSGEASVREFKPQKAK